MIGGCERRRGGGDKKKIYMGKSAFKRSESILETINIVYLPQQLLHSPSLPLCCVLSELLSYLFTLNEFRINCFWHFSTNALMHEQKTCNPFSLTRYYALTTVYDVSIDKLHVWWAPALHTVVNTWTSVQFFLLPESDFFSSFSCIQEQQQTIEQ